MNLSKKYSLGFKVAAILALICALIVFVSGCVFLMIVKMKRINDLTTHSNRIAVQISEMAPIRAFLLEQPGVSNVEETKQLITALLQGDPFIEQFILIDQFGKIPFQLQLNETESDHPTRTSISTLALQELLEEAKPSLLEDNWEYCIPLSFDSAHPWGVMKVVWRPEATWKYFNLLKEGIAYGTLVSFAMAFGLGLLLLGRTYGSECRRLVKSLSLFTGSDYNQRIDTQFYSKGLSEIIVHINRILHEMEEEKQKSVILDQTLRQVERDCSEYRRTSHVRTTELDLLRREMREGLVQLFDLLWCGIMILDDHFQIQYINDQAERLLRFARLEDQYIQDERLRGCLGPLIRQGVVDTIDDLCVWPQPSLGQSVSCQVRASKIRAANNQRLFFVLMREEGGYPKKHNSAYYSERLILDYLIQDQTDEEQSTVPSNRYRGHVHQEDRFRACLRRLETFHALEQGNYGPVSAIRLTSWLRHHFHDEDLFSQYLRLDANVQDTDLSLRVPERVLRELVDTVMMIICRLVETIPSQPAQYMVMRTLVDSRGKPVVTLSLPCLRKKQAAHIHEVLNERATPKLAEESAGDDTLQELELDICYSLFRCVKQLLRAQVICVYSESKKLAMVRITIENHSFSAAKEEGTEPKNSFSEQPDLVKQILGRL